MPSKYVIRSFSQNSFYHVFNRGIEKKIIFNDAQDYKMFKYYLEVYLLPIEKVLEKHKKLPIRLHSKNMHNSISLLAYSLMPNHIHLLLQQKPSNGVSEFMKRITNAYTEYFNKKYARTGSLMVGRFKAVKIYSEDLLIHISRYIHLNPIVASITNDLQYAYSSYPDYADNNDLVDRTIILNRFKSIKEYEKFTVDQIGYAKELNKLKHLTID